MNFNFPFFFWLKKRFNEFLTTGLFDKKKKKLHSFNLINNTSDNTNSKSLKQDEINKQIHNTSVNKQNVNNYDKNNNMTKLKCLEYTCFRICNVEDVNLVDWICTESEVICRSELRTLRRDGKEKQCCT